MAEDCQVCAFERSGHGRSADIDADYSYVRGIADTLAFLDAQGLESVHVIGYSDGAIIGLMLAMEHPERGALWWPSAPTLVPQSSSPQPATAPDLAPRRRPPMRSAQQPRGEKKADLEGMLYGQLSPDGAGHADTVLAKLMRVWTSEPPGVYLTGGQPQAFFLRQGKDSVANARGQGSAARPHQLVEGI